MSLFMSYDGHVHRHIATPFLRTYGRESLFQLCWYFHHWEKNWAWTNKWENCTSLVCSCKSI